MSPMPKHDLDDLVGTIDMPTTKRGQPRQRRPKHVPTDKDRQDVAAWVCAGIPFTAMADLLRIDETTLRRCYPTELEHGTAIANGAVAKQLMQQVLAGNVTAMIWWTKTKMGWREKAPEDNQVLVKVDGKPVDAKELAHELREALIESQRVHDLSAAASTGGNGKHTVQ